MESGYFLAHAPQPFVKPEHLLSQVVPARREGFKLALGRLFDHQAPGLLGYLLFDKTPGVGLEDGEGGIDTGLEGSLPQQAAAETVDGAYGGAVDAAGEVGAAATDEFPADTLGQLGAGFAGEGDGGQVLQRHPPVQERVDEVGHQQARLAATGTCRYKAPRCGLGQDLELRRRQLHVFQVAHPLKPPLRALQTGPSRHHEGQAWSTGGAITPLLMPSAASRASSLASSSI